MITGKRIDVVYKGKHITVLNQRSRLWTHPYDYRAPQKATLSSAGCGVFSVCHCGQWLTGKEFSPEELADFSMANGGRGDDGTDRPALLSAMMKTGLAKDFGFRYENDGLRNDRDALRAHLREGRGVALCNLRAGHIVALMETRAGKAGTQVLVIDPYSETTDARVLPLVREVISGTEIVSALYNEMNVLAGYQTQYAMYWADDSTVRDFNLLHAL